MDVPRLKKPKRGRWIALAIVLAAAAVVSVALGRLKEAPPAVDAATVTIATVARGPMLRDVRAQGTLVPLEMRWVTAETSGRVDTIAYRAGAEVKADTIVVELTNPDTLLDELQTEREIASAEADLLQLSYRLQSEKLTQENLLWSLRQEMQDVKRRSEAYQRGGEAVFTQLDILQMKDRAAALEQRVSVAETQLKTLDEGYKTQVAAQRAQIERRRKVAEFRQRQVESLHVRAGGDGVVQDMPLEVGQWVTPGTVLAKIAKPDRLKALLRVPEVQAKDVAIGQSAKVDTRNGIVPGHVARVAPAATQGTVQVEVYLDGDLPAGARPDLNVDGTIEIERLDDVVYVDRPVGAQSDRPMSLFRVAEGGKEAVRVEVQIGRLSVTSAELRQGPREGARLIVSDMSRWDGTDRIALR